MKFTDPSLEVTLFVKPNGDFTQECASRETMRVLAIVKMAARQVAARNDAKQIQAAMQLPLGRAMEINLTVRRDGGLVLRSTCREEPMVVRALVNVATRLERVLNHRRFARTGLVLPASHRGVVEKVTAR